MIRFVNAKINIGLQIVRRREDGYHELQTVFYPVGLYAGTPRNPVEFRDILEIVPREKVSAMPFSFRQTGRGLDCPEEKNLVWRAARLYFERCATPGFAADITLDKHLPDGAGMGGGSADAAFTLRLLRDLELDHAAGICLSQGEIPDDTRLAEMALTLGADCPFFIYNRPAFAEGIGERLQPVGLDLAGCMLLVAKPHVSISTREAFAGITPREPDFDLREIDRLPMELWRDKIKNDFEIPFFGKFPELLGVKEEMYGCGALYSSLTGSGSCIYGIFPDAMSAEAARAILSPSPLIASLYLLSL